MVGMHGAEAGDALVLARAAQSLMPATLSGRVATGWMTARSMPLRAMLSRRPASVPS